MMPDPQMPVMPLSATVKVRNRPRRTRARSRSPGSAAPWFRGRCGSPRWRRVRRAGRAKSARPRRRGRSGEEQASTRVLLPSRSSALVPTSTMRTRSSDFPGSSDKATAARLRRHGPRYRAGCRYGAAGGREVRPSSSRLEVQRIRRRKGKGRLSEFHRVDAEQKVVHHRVADEDRLEDQRRIDIRLGGDIQLPARRWPRAPQRSSPCRRRDSSWRRRRGS